MAENSKKLIVISVVLIIIILLIFIGIMLRDQAPKCSPINVNLGEWDKLETTLCYCNNEKMIFSVGDWNGFYQGPLVNTKSLIVYDWKDEKVSEEYILDRESYIYHIIPYKEGLIYSDYEYIEGGAVRWSVNYHDGEKITIIDEGISRDYTYIPSFIYSESKIIYICEDIIDGNYYYRLKKVEDGEIITLEESLQERMISASARSNGKEYCYVTYEEGVKYPYFIIGDSNGIKSKTPLDGLIIDFGITGKYAVCSTGLDGIFEAVKVNIKTGEKSKFSSGPLYRIKGGSGKSCLYVNNSFEIFELDLENEERWQLECDVLTKRESGKKAVSFYSIGANEYIAGYHFEKEYFRLKV